MGLIISTDGAGFPPRGETGSFKLPFQEQIDFFNQKLALPSQHYDDILKSAHDRAFIVAGAAKADLLADLHRAVGQTITDGKTIKWFRSEFDAIVKKHGWTGWTGEGTEAGVAWRTRVIYQTNLSTSYAAGRWAQLNDPDLLKVRPYWKYIHNDAVAHPRPLHESWNGTVLRYDNPWWATHFCPNGWGCRCRIMAVRASEFKGHAAPDDGTYQFIDRKGVAHTLPNGVDYGFDYAPSQSIHKELLANKVAALPEPLATALKNDVAKVVADKTKKIKLQTVSSRFRLPKAIDAQRAEVVNTLSIIDSVHKTDSMPMISIKSIDSKDFSGSYRHKDGNPIDMKLSTFSRHKELTLAHEIGHFLDHQTFDSIGEFSSVSSALFEEWRTAVDMSEATKNIVALGNVKNADYFLSKNEQWARSYAQYIATKSGDTTLIAQVAKITNSRSVLYKNSQWSNDDFLPILTAIDAIFKARGWL